ncbi:MAG: hypothetical protein GX963_13740 [Bacteroidales bacterium]|nr:hypothetical protein [Bacteroidales bacterium]
MKESFPDNISFFAQGWHPLPYWAKFFCALGYWTAIHNRTHKYRVSISAPVRDYAATFIVLGLTVGSIRFDSMSVHFETLCSLEYGTPLFYMDKLKRKKARFAGTEEHPVFNELAIKIRLESKESGGLTEYIARNRAHLVSVTEQDFTLPGNQKGYSIDANLDLISIFFGLDDPMSFISNSSYDSLIVGTLTTISEELKNTRFLVERGNVRTEGTLVDLVRPRCLIGEIGFHTDIISSTSSSGSIKSGFDPASVVVIDGANAFLRTNMDYSDHSQIVIFDRSERKYQDAITLINQEYLLGNFEKPNLDVIKPTKIPSGVLFSITTEQRGVYSGAAETY